MVKFYFKLKKYLKEKGFTLVELLTIIVILAIIMLIAIPGILDILERSQRKTFMQYADRVIGVSNVKATNEVDELDENGITCIIYNIKTDLNLANTGSFQGWVLINRDTDDIYITLFNDKYAVVMFHYSDKSLKIEDYMKVKDSVDPEELTSEYLCNHSNCSSCSEGDKTIDNAEFILKNSAILDTGSNIRSKMRKALNITSSYKDDEVTTDFVRNFNAPNTDDKFDISTSD